MLHLRGKLSRKRNGIRKRRRRGEYLQHFHYISSMANKKKKNKNTDSNRQAYNFIRPSDFIRQEQAAAPTAAAAAASLQPSGKPGHILDFVFPFACTCRIFYKFRPPTLGFYCAVCIRQSCSLNLNTDVLIAHPNTQCSVHTHTRKVNSHIHVG